MAKSNWQLTTNKIRDLGIACSEDASKEIEVFINRHFRKTLPPKVLIDVISLLADLHKSDAQNSRYVLNFLYNEQGSISYDDFVWLSENKASILDCANGSEEALQNIKDNTTQGGFILRFFLIIERLFYAKQTEENTLVSALDKEYVCTPKTLYLNSKVQHNDTLGAYQTLGGKRQQEDTYASLRLPESVASLTPEEIGERIWTAHRNLAQNFAKKDIGSGTTACTTVYTKDALVTATVADTLAFAIIHDKDGKRKVQMLSQRIINPRMHEELNRLLSEQASVFRRGKNIYRLNNKYGNCSVINSRSIGDIDFKGISADSDINILHLDEYPNAEKIQIVTACDGFFDPIFIYTEELDNASDEQLREYYEKYIEAILSECTGDESEAELAKHLANKAMNPNGLNAVCDGQRMIPSQDNVTVTIQTINPSAGIAAGMLGLYDGHGGSEASVFVAENIGQEMTNLIHLSPEEYADQENSVIKKREDYLRDNPENTSPQTELRV